MRCPKCDSLPTAVIKTERPVDEGLDGVKRRKRRCRNCRHISQTFEIPESEYRKLYPAPEKAPEEKAVRSPLKTKLKKEKSNDRPTKS